MSFADWFRPPRHVLTIVLAMAVVSAAAFAGLAWNLLQQDRHLEEQRRDVERERTADALIESMRQSLTSLEARLGQPSPGAPLSADVTAITITGDDIVTSPPAALLYYPVAAVAPPFPVATFLKGEQFELVDDNTTAAAAEYSRIATSAHDAAIRAAALMRLGRVERKRHRTIEALETYDALEKLDPVIVEGLPASLVAQYGRLSAFREAGRERERDRQAAKMATELEGGQWRLTQDQYDAYRDELSSSARQRTNALMAARAEAAAFLWEHRGIAAPITRRAVAFQAGSALVVWRSTEGRLDGLIAGPTFLATLGAGVVDRPDWSISDLEGHPLLGHMPARKATLRSAIPSGLPWNVHVFAPEGQRPPGFARSPLLLGVIGLVTFVLCGGWYATYRAVSHERRVARLQSDFVAAVSHEFRTPLTALSHAADLLVNDRLAADAPRRPLYEVLARDTLRLRTLVEDLLEFSRLESKASPFILEEADLDGLVQATAESFATHVHDRGYRIQVSGTLEGSHAQVDRPAMERAIRNLLDNAVKYSPDAKTVEIALSRAGDTATIAVRDRGLGIPATEQQAVFERFVRGAESKARRIHGTGIGLAMVRQIVRAHGGEVTLVSEPGQGSTFTIVLPLSQVHAARSVGAAQAPERVEATRS